MRSSLGAIICGIGLSLLFCPSAKASSIALHCDPERVQPFEAEAKTPQLPPTITFNVKRQKNERLRLQIELPAKTPLLSTDFPMIEGKTLLDVETELPDNGTWNIQPMLPIRGDYVIPAEVLSGSKLVDSKTLPLHVRERPSKYWYFAALALVLLVAGVGGGWIIGGKQDINDGQLAPTRVELLLVASTLVAIVAMLALAISAEMNIHHHDKPSAADTSKDSPTIEDERNILSLSGDKETTVGCLANFTVQVKRKPSNEPAEQVPVHVKVQQLEDDFPTLMFTGITNHAGQVTWREAFFDGAPHMVEANLDSKGERSARQSVVVEAIHPPLYRRLITLVYMMAFMLLGLLLGLAAKQRVLKHQAWKGKLHRNVT